MNSFVPLVLGLVALLLSPVFVVLSLVVFTRTGRERAGSFVVVVLQLLANLSALALFLVRIQAKLVAALDSWTYHQWALTADALDPLDARVGGRSVAQRQGAEKLRNEVINAHGLGEEKKPVNLREIRDQADGKAV